MFNQRQIREPKFVEHVRDEHRLEVAHVSDSWDEQRIYSINFLTTRTSRFTLIGQHHHKSEMKSTLTFTTAPSRKLVDYTQRRASEPQEQEICMKRLKATASLSLCREERETHRGGQTVSNFDITTFLNTSFKSINSEELTVDDVESESDAGDDEMVDFFLKIPSRHNRARASTSTDLREQFDRHAGKSASKKKHSFIQAILSEPAMRSRRTQQQ